MKFYRGYEFDRKYFISNIIPKNGKPLRDLHLSAIGGECEIIEAIPGERGLIRVVMDYDPDKKHRIHTSMIKDITVSANMNHIIITTENSQYVIDALEQHNDSEGE